MNAGFLKTQSLFFIFTFSFLYFSISFYSPLFAADPSPTPTPTAAYNLTSPSISALPHDLAVPCNYSGTTTDPTNNYLRPCVDFFKDHFDVAGTGFLTSLKERMKMVYTHKIMPSVTDTNLPDPTKNCESKGNPYTVCGAVKSHRFADIVCSLTPNFFNDNTAEFDTNHKGEACGEYVFIGFSVDWGGGNTTINIDQTRGGRERNWSAGAYVQAVAHYYNEIKNEVQIGKKLKVSAPCQPIAADLARIATTSSSLADNVNTRLQGSGNIKDIWKCENNWAELEKREGVDVGKIRQSAQHLCATRKNLEAAFSQLMVCENFSRAGSKYVSVFGADGSNLRSLIEANVGNPCGSRCNSNCDGCEGDWDDSGYPRFGRCGSCGQSCINDCYKNGQPGIPKIGDYLKSLILSHWPNGTL